MNCHIPKFAVCRSIEPYEYITSTENLIMDCSIVNGDKTKL